MYLLVSLSWSLCYGFGVIPLIGQKSYGKRRSWILDEFSCAKIDCPNFAFFLDSFIDIKHHKRDSFP